jgi:L-threonylcarbamoyladenylate synthase
MIRRFKRPVVSTSANISGKPAPSCFAEIDPEIIEAVDYVVKFRQDDDQKAVPSSIIKLGRGGEIRIIRE